MTPNTVTIDPQQEIIQTLMADINRSEQKAKTYIEDPNATGHDFKMAESALSFQADLIKLLKQRINTL